MSWPAAVIRQERGVVHAERAGDVFLDHHVQRGAAGRLDDFAQPVGVDAVVVVVPGRAAAAAPGRSCAGRRSAAAGCRWPLPTAAGLGHGPFSYATARPWRSVTATWSVRISPRLRARGSTRSPLVGEVRVDP
jgi:hypothetical protein